jgi:hypothetical protein
VYLAPFYRFQDYKKSHMHIVIYKLELLKLIGYVGSWSGIATTRRRQATPCSRGPISSDKSRFFFLDKYLMNTYQASVRAQVKGRSQVIKTEVRAMNTQEARWLLWAQFGFHSIQAGPVLRKSNKQP